MKRLFLFMWCLLWIVACSDAGTDAVDMGATDSGVQDAAPSEAGIGNDPTPEKIPGGGTSGGAINGRLNVYVLEQGTDEPLDGAFVMIDDGSTHKGHTNAEGLITFRRPGLNGPLALTVGKKGYTTHTVVGLNAANATLNLESGAVPPPPKTGTCSGTVKDWDTLPPLPRNHFRVGLATFLLDEDLDSPNSDLEQPPGNLNMYAPGPPLNRDNWILKVTAGDFGVALLVLDMDTKGTTSQDDDEATLTHVGMSTGLKVGEGQLLAGVEVEVTPADRNLTLKPPALPAETSALQASILVQLESSEIVPLMFGATGQTSFSVPALAGGFSGGNYWVVLSASGESDETDDDRKPMSLSITREITDLSRSVEAPLLDLPADLKLQGRTVSFTPPAQSSFSSLSLLPETVGPSHWNVTFLSTQTSITLPTLPADAKLDPLPPGRLYLLATAMELDEVDLNEARFRELAKRVERISRQGATVDHIE